MDTEHSRSPKSNDGFVFSDDLEKWMHSRAGNKNEKQREYDHKRRAKKSWG
jgi:hypothetical protein